MSVSSIGRWCGAAAVIAAVFVVVAAGCVAAADGEEGVLGPRARDVVYDASCAVVADCVVVAYAVCFCGGCGDLAINTSEEGRFNDDNVITGCSTEDGIPQCGACEPVRAACTDGICAVEVCPDGDCDA